MARTNPNVASTKHADVETESVQESDLNSSPSETSADHADPKPTLKADAEIEDTRPADRIEYVGPASQRIVSSEDWTNVGAEGDDAEWNFGNYFSLPTSDFTSAQQDYLLNTDGRFRRVNES